MSLDQGSDDEHTFEFETEVPLTKGSIAIIVIGAVLVVGIIVGTIGYVNVKNAERDKAVQTECISSGGSYLVVGGRPTCLQIGARGQ